MGMVGWEAGYDEDLEDSNNSRNIEVMNMYQLVMNAINGMEVGDCNVISLPDNLGYFRKYLSEVSKREGKKFTTKVMDNTLHILRIKYSNIYSKEIE